MTELMVEKEGRSGGKSRDDLQRHNRRIRGLMGHVTCS